MAAASADQAAPPQGVERILIYRVALALPDQRAIRHEPEPDEVVEHRVLVSLAAALPVVIFDAQQDAAISA